MCRQAIWPGILPRTYHDDTALWKCSRVSEDCLSLASLPSLPFLPSLASLQTCSSCGAPEEMMTCAKQLGLRSRPRKGSLNHAWQTLHYPILIRALRMYDLSHYESSHNLSKEKMANEHDTCTRRNESDCRRTKHPIVCRQLLGHQHRWALQCGSVIDLVTYLPKNRASWSTSLLCSKKVPLLNCFVEKGRKEDVCISLTATVFPCFFQSPEWCLTRLGMSLASPCAPDCWRWCWYLTVYAWFVSWWSKHKHVPSINHCNSGCNWLWNWFQSSTSNFQACISSTYMAATCPWTGAASCLTFVLSKGALGKFLVTFWHCPRELNEGGSVLGGWSWFNRQSYLNSEASQKLV